MFDIFQGGNNDIGDFVDDAVIAADKSDLLMTKGANLTNEDGFSSQESDALQMTSSTSYNRRYGGANDKENMSPLVQSFSHQQCFCRHEVLFHSSEQLHCTQILVRKFFKC